MIADLLASRAEMLLEYFAIDVDAEGAAFGFCRPPAPRSCMCIRGSSGLRRDVVMNRTPLPASRFPPGTLTGWQVKPSEACPSYSTSTAQRRSGSRHSSSASEKTRAGAFPTPSLRLRIGVVGEGSGALAGGWGLASALVG